MKLKVIATGSTGNCYYLQSNSGEILLLDVGIKYSKILKGIDYKINNVCGALLTHIHGDHALSVHDVTNARVEVYTNNETLADINIRTGELITSLTERKKYQIGEYTVCAFYVPHDDTVNYAYLIHHKECGYVLYATDFEYLPYTFKKIGVNHFLIECNHINELIDTSIPNWKHSIKGHSDLKTVKGIITANKTEQLRTITLCHLSSRWSEIDVMQKEIQSITDSNVLTQIATKGLEIDLNLVPF